MKKHTPFQILRHYLSMMVWIILLMGIWNTSSQAQTNNSKAEKEEAKMADAKLELEREFQKLEKFKKSDLEKVMKELEKAQMELQNKDWSKIESEMQAVKEKLERSLREVQKTLEKKEIEKAIQDVEESTVLQKGKLQEQLKRAEEKLEKAKMEMGRLTKGIDLLEKDGLIKHNDYIKIDWDGDFMILNGKKLSKEVSDKYKPYFKGKEAL